MGLIREHAYGLIDAYQHEDKNGDVMRDRNGNDIKLLKIRNPWGEHEWNGDWSDQSDLWTDELKKACKYIDADDGTFWMNFQDFQKCFGRF